MNLGVFSGSFHWEIKGRFRKRVVLANVPSFRFSFRGNIRRNHPFGNHPFVNTKKGYWEIKGRFRKRVVLANVPSFRFSFRGNIRQNHPFGNHPFANPRSFTLFSGCFSLYPSAHALCTLPSGIFHSSESKCDLRIVFSAGPICTKEKEIYCRQGSSERLFRKMALV